MHSNFQGLTRLLVLLKENKKKLHKHEEYFLPKAETKDFNGIAKVQFIQNSSKLCKDCAKGVC